MPSCLLNIIHNAMLIHQDASRFVMSMDELARSLRGISVQASAESPTPVMDRLPVFSNAHVSSNSKDLTTTLVHDHDHIVPESTLAKHTLLTTCTSPPSIVTLFIPVASLENTW